MSARCPVCRKQIRRPSYVNLKDRRSRREIRYHGARTSPRVWRLPPRRPRAEDEVGVLRSAMRS